MQSLAANDIARLAVTGQFDGRTLEGNLIHDATTYTKLSGGTAEMLEVFFTYNEFNTAFVGNGGLDAAIDPATLALPLSRGYGSMASLQVAMTQDATLKGMVEALGDTSLAEYGQTRADVEAILLRWAEVGTPPAYNNFDANRLAFLETLTNREFTLIQGPTVSNNAIPFLNEAWEQALQVFSDRLLVQGMLHDIFPNASYDFATDSLHLGSTLTEIITHV